MRGKVSKMVKMVLLAFYIVMTVFAINVKAADMNSVSKKDECERVVKAYSAEKVTKYLDGDNQYPKMDGYLFSGWYTDKACNQASALAGKTPKDTVYALFVPEHILSVQAQVSYNLVDNDGTNDSSASLRFVTSVDTELYKQIGFDISYVDANGKVRKATNVSKTVYKKLYVAGSSSEIWEEVTPEGTFCGLSTYFRACTITGIPTSNHVTEFTARPFWVTLDGDKVYGVEATKRIVDGCLREEVWVSSDTTSNGQDEYNYGSYDYPYNTLDYAIDHVIDGGVVHVKDSLTVAGSETWKVHGKQVTITGDDTDTAEETLSFDSNVIHIYDAVKFTGLKMVFADNTTLYACGNRLEIASDVTGIDKTDENALRIYGGARTALTDDTELIICAGTYQSVYGGGNGVTVTGNTHLTIGGTANVTSVYGGGCQAEVIGDTYVTMNGGYAQEIFGGCESANLQGNTNVRVEGGQVKRRVYGGCYNASTQSEEGYLWSTTLSLAWEEQGYQVTGNTNVSVAGNVNLLFDYSETLEGTFMDKNIEMDNSLIATSRYQTAFQNEYGTLIFNDNLYSTLSGKAGFTCNYEVTSGSPNATYHYLVQANISANEDGEVYSEGDCLHIVPGQDKAATVRLGSNTGNIVFYTMEESYYPLPEPSSTTTNIYVDFDTNEQTNEQKTFMNETAEARIGSAYYKTIEEALSAAEKVEGAKVISLKDGVEVVALEIVKNGFGTVKTGKNNYLVGETVSVTVKPSEGYSCTDVKVTQDGNNVALNKTVTSVGGTYQFEASKEQYTIETTFVQMSMDEIGYSWQPDEQIDNLNESDVTETDYYTARDYIEYPSLFEPMWSETWNPPAELLDFEKKWEAFFTPDGRLMSMAHRADNNIYYPENSIEGIMSCIAAGVDMIEIDIATTKDGVHVLMHDDTVTRTTNVSQLRAAGVTGLPDSDNVSDWTFEQLRRLRLVRETANGNVVTNYVIPTYEDVVMICADKIFVYMDIKDTNSFEWEQDAYPIIQKYNAYRSIWLPFDYINWMSEEQLASALNTIGNASGYRAAFQCGVSISTNENNVAERVQMIEDCGLPLALRAGNYDESTYDSVFAPYFDKYRIHVNTIFTAYDTLDNWKNIHKKGYNSIQVDDYMTLVQYIGENMTSQEKSVSGGTTYTEESTGVQYVYYEDITSYRRGEYSYPKKAGYVFAGWWNGVTKEELAEYAVSISRNTTSGGAWAKYVPEEILRVEAQVSEKVASVFDDGLVNPSNTSEGVKLRLVTGVDASDKYTEVGFKIKVQQEQYYKSSHFYDELTVREDENSQTVYPENVFHNAATQFATYVISGFDTVAEINETDLSVTPYWITKDGTIVEGKTRKRLLVADERATDSDGSKTDGENDFGITEDINMMTYTYLMEGASQTTSYQYFTGASDTVYLKGIYMPSNTQNVKFGITIRNGGQTRQVIFSNVGVLVTNGVEGGSVDASGLVNGNANAYTNVTYTDNGVYVWARKVSETATDSAIKDMLSDTSPKSVIWAIEKNILYCSIDGDTVLRLPMELLCSQWLDGRYYQLGVAAYNAVANTTNDKMTFEVQALEFGEDASESLIPEPSGMTTVQQMIYEPIHGTYKSATVTGISYGYGNTYKGSISQVLSTEIRLPAEGSFTSSSGLYLKGGEMKTQIVIHGTGDKMMIRFDSGATTIEVTDWITQAIGETAYYSDGVCKLTAAIKDETLFIFINEKLAGSVDLYKVLSKSGVGIYIEGATPVALGVCVVDASGGQSSFGDVTYFTGDSAEKEIERLMTNVTEEHEWEIFTNNGVINGTGNSTTNNGYAHTVTVNQTGAANCHTYGVTTRMPQQVTATYSFGELTGNADATASSGNGIIVRWGTNTYIYGINGYGEAFRRATGFNFQQPDTNANITTKLITRQAYANGVYNITAVVKDGVVYVQYNDKVMFIDDLTSLGLTGSTEVRLGVYTRSQANVTTRWTNVHFEAGTDVKVPTTQVLQNLSNMVYDEETIYYTPDSVSGLAYACGEAYKGSIAQVLSTEIQIPVEGSVTSSSGLYLKGGEMETRIVIHGTGDKATICFDNGATTIEVTDWITQAIGETAYYTDGVCKLTAAIKDETLFIFINEKLAGSVDLYKLFSKSGVDIYIEGTTPVALGVCVVDANGGQSTFGNVTCLTGDSATTEVERLMTNVTEEHEWEIFTNNGVVNGTGNNTTNDGYTHAVTVNQTGAANCHTYGVTTSMPQQVTATYSFGELTGNADATASSGNGIIVRWGANTYIYGINGYGEAFRRATGFNFQQPDTNVNITTKAIEGQAHTNGVYNITAVVKDGVVYVKYNNTVMFTDDLTSLGLTGSVEVRLGIYTRSQANVTTQWTNVRFEAGADIKIPTIQDLRNLSNMIYDEETLSYMPDSVSGLAYACGEAYKGTIAQVLSTEIQLPAEGSVTSSSGLYLKGGEMKTQIVIHGTGDKATIRFDNGATTIEVKDWITQAIGETAYYTDGVCKLTAAIKDETLFIFINEKLAGSVDLYKVLSKSGVGIYIEGATPVALGVCAVDASGGQSAFGNVTYLTGDSATTAIERLMTNVTEQHEWEIFTNNGVIDGAGNNTTNDGYMHSVTVNQTGAANCHTYGVTTRMPQQVTATYSFGELTGNADATASSGNGIIVRWGANTYIYGINGYGEAFRRATGFNFQQPDTNANITTKPIEDQAHTDGVYNITAVVKDGVVYVKYNNIVMFTDDLTSLGLTGSSEVRLGIYTRSQANVTTQWTNVRFEAGEDVVVPTTQM